MSIGVTFCPLVFVVCLLQNCVFFQFCFINCLRILSHMYSVFPREGFDSSVIMHFSWCVVAVTLPI